MRYYSLFILSLILVTTTGCYRMPTDDDSCVVPCTNNPHLTGSSAHTCIPGIGK